MKRSSAPSARGIWVTAAAWIMVVEGVVGLVYAPIMGAWPVPALVLGSAIVGIITGVGLFRLAGWARTIAGILAVVWVLLDVTAVLRMVTELPAASATLVPGIPVELVLWLIVLFAVMRRWPARASKGRRGGSDTHPPAA